LLTINFSNKLKTLLFFSLTYVISVTISNRKFLNEIIGYRICAHRSIFGKSFDQMNKNDIPSIVTRQIQYLINSGNDSSIIRKPLFNRHNENNENISPCELFESHGTIETEQEPEPASLNTKKRMTCCACGISNRTNTDLDFFKIPRTKIILNDKSSNEKRIIYYWETYQRKVYLQRFGLPTNSQQQYLTYCSYHKMQSEIFEIFYKNLEGKKKTTCCKIVVPEDPLAEKLPPTRASRLLIHSPPPMKQRRCNNNISVDENEFDEEDVFQITAINLSKHNKKTNFRKCSYHKCCSRWNVNMTLIPCLPTKIPKQYHTHNFDRLKRASKVVHRAECLKRIGVLCPSNVTDNKDYCICGKQR
jgi:hypothetical protein